LFRKPDAVKPEKLVKDMSKGSASKEDIITALHDTEKKVVRFMLDEQEKHLRKEESLKHFYVLYRFYSDLSEKGMCDGK